MGQARNRTTDLEATRESLTNWRRVCGGPGRRIPEAYWDAAGELARVHGVAVTARALDLNAGRLAAMVEQAEGVATTTVEPAAFVELGGLAFGERGVVEFLGREGDCVRVPVGAKGVDIVALAAAFWGRRP
jgi:hypothetical protein